MNKYNKIVIVIVLVFQIITVVVGAFTYINKAFVYEYMHTPSEALDAKIFPYFLIIPVLEMILVIIYIFAMKLNVNKIVVAIIFMIMYLGIIFSNNFIDGYASKSLFMQSMEALAGYNAQLYFFGIFSSIPKCLAEVLFYISGGMVIGQKTAKSY